MLVCVYNDGVTYEVVDTEIRTGEYQAAEEGIEYYTKAEITNLLKAGNIIVGLDFNAKDDDYIDRDMVFEDLPFDLSRQKKSYCMVFLSSVYDDYTIIRNDKNIYLYNTMTSELIHKIPIIPFTEYSWVEDVEIRKGRLQVHYDIADEPDMTDDDATSLRINYSLKDLDKITDIVVYVFNEEFCDYTDYHCDELPVTSAYADELIKKSGINAVLDEECWQMCEDNYCRAYLNPDNNRQHYFVAQGKILTYTEPTVECIFEG
jgi:hypothetical protein